MAALVKLRYEDYPTVGYFADRIGDYETVCAARVYNQSLVYTPSSIAERVALFSLPLITELNEEIYERIASDFKPYFDTAREVEYQPDTADAVWDAIVTGLSLGLYRAPKTLIKGGKAPFAAQEREAGLVLDFCLKKIDARVVPASREELKLLLVFKNTLAIHQVLLENLGSARAICKPVKEPEC
jgi:hypothetical protein